MKLTNPQVTALAEKISASLREEAAEHNKAIEGKKRELIEAALNTKENKSLLAYYTYLKDHKCFSTSTVESFLKTTVLKDKLNKLPDIKTTPFLSAIKNDIILETIEAVNVEEIMERIKEKYK